MQIYGARPYQAGDLAQFDRITTELARRAGLPHAPHLYVVPSMLLSSFSVGSSRRFATALTEGLLRRLTMREVAALLAREVAHAQRGDLLVFGIADVVTRCAQAFYYVGLTLAALNVLRSIGGGEPTSWLSVALLVAAPVLMTLLQLALSHAREIEVDRAAALLTGDPLGVASAISRLDTSPGSITEELLPPVPARKVPLPSMLRLMPPSEQRIATAQRVPGAAHAAARHRRRPAHLAHRSGPDRDASALSAPRRLVLAVTSTVPGDEALSRACIAPAFARISR